MKIKIEEDVLLSFIINEEHYPINKLKVAFTNLKVSEWIRVNLPKYDLLNLKSESVGLCLYHYGTIYIICTNYDGKINFDTFQHELYHAVIKFVIHNFGPMDINHHEEAGAILMGAISTAVMKKIKKYKCYYENASWIK